MHVCKIVMSSLKSNIYGDLNKLCNSKTYVVYLQTIDIAVYFIDFY